jgi:uncharacterized protein YbbC (DUF1343 family)
MQQAAARVQVTVPEEKADSLQIGAARTELYLPTLLEAKGVALVVNQTSTIDSIHLVDSLLSLGVKVKTIFAPEHGFRGQADAGESVADGKDTLTGLPIVSLYGSNKKPRAEQLDSIDIIVFDIQDVGARFYTYISTLHYIMEACAEQGITLIVLDRPNPNGHYVDGPVLDTAYRSFVGMHPVPVVHGMTVGEYAQMINGEGWISQKAELNVVPCAGYTHQTPYELPIKPSPNLPNMRAIYLYPSLCFFEGTVASVGRGTDTQFQVYGHPADTVGTYTFVPTPMPGAKYPKHEGDTCRGVSLTHLPADSIRCKAQLDLTPLIKFYQAFPQQDSFFLPNFFFDLLAGSDRLRKQIQSGQSAEAIRESWQEELEAFRQMRQPYLLYEE